MDDYFGNIECPQCHYPSAFEGAYEDVLSGKSEYSLFCNRCGYFRNEQRHINKVEERRGYGAYIREEQNETYRDSLPSDPKERQKVIDELLDFRKKGAKVTIRIVLDNGEIREL